MFDTVLTIAGNVVADPKLRRTKNGHWVANFRVASTPRRLDRESGQWVDGDTLYVSVTAWRALGENVAQSLHRGDPVVVTGRYYQREYVLEDKPRTAYELEASVVGHDLTRGVSAFTRHSRLGGAAAVLTDADGTPSDASEHYLSLAEDDAVLEEIDVHTGEVHELASAG